jgi:nicotinate-nucleotide--dimethylbenzimidazole phosphoribosyltransferase
MATTDARTGFRLPWGSDQRPPTDDEDGTLDPAATTESSADDTAGAAADSELPAAVDEPVVVDEPAAIEAPVSAAEPVASHDEDPGAPMSVAAAAAPRARPSKFLAELTKAMQAAAEAAREETLSRFKAEAKTHVEQIHGRSAEDAGALRRGSDDDVASIREWSKAEIARIREETETRITDRKVQLERELEAHAARIERRIEHVQGAVEAFEGEMAGFFERLLAEEDPTRFASMAEHLPEPTPFAFADEDAPVALAAPAPVAEPTSITDVADETAADEAFTAEPEAVASVPEHEPAAIAEVADLPDAAGSPEPVEATEELVADTIPVDDAAEATSPDVAPVDGSGSSVGSGADAALAEAEAAAAAWEAMSPLPETPNGVAEAAHEPEVAADHGADEGADAAEVDPRLAALALSPDPSDAEMPFAEMDDTAEAEEIPIIADDALAARLAGLVAASDEAAPVETLTTRVVVTGLVSVASIASFKRHLGRLESVQAVGVTSGPEGEFVFTVTHGPDVAIRDTVPSLPGFQARVTGSEDGVVHVSAHDPEAEG